VGSSVSSSRLKYPIRELEVLQPDGTIRKVPLQKDLLTLGRNPSNDLSFPDDPILSREHLKFEFDGGEWFVADKGSKNGTLLNDQRLEARTRLKPGDRVGAGRVMVTFVDPRSASRTSLVFVEDTGTTRSGGATMVIRLDRVLSDEPKALEAALGADSIDGIRRTEALIHAGRELVGHRPLEELFPMILQLATRAVGARRGLLATLEGEELVVRAAQGESFRITTAVRDRVLSNRESLLVKDADADDRVRGSRTIFEQGVRALMAAPLQTEDKVIGLIYVDAPDLVRPFTAEDLSLLTVMANTAAIRIEHARLSEVEQMERLMEKDLEQAAEIQRSMLPLSPPNVAGFELAGHSVPCHAVGGDYFDYIELADGRTAVVVADVAGKGMPAALLMTGLHARVQILAETETDPGAFLTRLNRSTHCPTNRFITFFIAVFDTATREVNYANAGHNPPFILNRSGKIQLLEGGGPPISILRGFAYGTERCCLEAGETLLLYSDGVTEAASAEEVIVGVRASLAAFVKDTPASDDITMVVARRLG
jgi:phosphoserine phosphatase RsbU/P